MSSSQPADLQLVLPGLPDNPSPIRKRRKRAPSPPVFKPYCQDQMMLLPPSLEELIPADHIVRVVNSVVERLDITPIMQTYKGGGTSSYHPLMLLKVVLYAYIERIYTVRRIAKALRENIHFMWLSGMQQPDFRTINNFCNGRLKGHIARLLASLVIYLAEAGYIDLAEYFVDGSKFLANANRHSHVWRKNVERFRKKIQEQIEQLLSQIEQANEEENRRYGDKDLPEMGEQAHFDEEAQEALVEEMNQQLKQFQQPSSCCSSDDFRQRISRIEDQLAKEESQEEGKSKEKLVKKKRILKKIKKKLLPRLERYEHQKQLLGNRNSYSKTDPDATFMRFSDNVLAAGYNVLIGCQNQFIINYSVHQNPADVVCFVDHMERFKELYSQLPQKVVGDRGFGSERNYRYLEEHGIENYLQYGSSPSKKSSGRCSKYSKQNFIYDAQKDVYRCPEGKELTFEEERYVQSADGYQRKVRRYQAHSCSSCPARELCCRGQGNRSISMSPQWERYKQQARQNLESEQGKQLRKRRGSEIETVFAHMKFNKKYPRFHRRGIEKIDLEVGLLSIAHNIEKIFHALLKISPA